MQSSTAAHVSTQFSHQLTLLSVPHLGQFQGLVCFEGLAKESNDLKIVDGISISGTYVSVRTRTEDAGGFALKASTSRV